MPAWAELMPDVEEPAVFLPKHQTVWEFAVQPHDHEIEFVVDKVEQTMQRRDRENTKVSSVTLQAWRDQLVTDARNLLGYCLQRNPLHGHALAAAAVLEYYAGNAVLAQTHAAGFFASQHIDPAAPELTDAMSKQEQTQIANVLLITALQAWHSNDAALAIRQLRTASMACQSRDQLLCQWIMLALVECLQQQQQHAEVQQQLRNVAPTMPVAVVLDRRERDIELAELSSQHRDEVLQELTKLGPVLAQLPHHEGTYYRALALEIVGQRAAARAQWILYVSDHQAHWRSRAQVHLHRLDAAVRAKP